MHVAFIEQAKCVQCSLCIEACPVDAITGSIGKEHIILENICIGCEKCVNPCPVDCISMITVPGVKNKSKKKLSKPKAEFINNKAIIIANLKDILGKKNKTDL